MSSKLWQIVSVLSLLLVLFSLLWPQLLIESRPILSGVCVIALMIWLRSSFAMNWIQIIVGGVAIFLPTGIAVWVGLRGMVQDRLLAHPLFPFMAPAEREEILVVFGTVLLVAIMLHGISNRYCKRVDRISLRRSLLIGFVTFAAALATPVVISFIMPPHGQVTSWGDPEPPDGPMSVLANNTGGETQIQYGERKRFERDKFRPFKSYRWDNGFATAWPDLDIVLRGLLREARKSDYVCSEEWVERLAHCGSAGVAQVMALVENEPAFEELAQKAAFRIHTLPINDFGNWSEERAEHLFENLLAKVNEQEVGATFHPGTSRATVVGTLAPFLADRFLVEKLKAGIETKSIRWIDRNSSTLNYLRSQDNRLALVSANPVLLAAFAKHDSMRRHEGESNAFQSEFVPWFLCFAKSESIINKRHWHLRSALALASFFGGEVFDTFVLREAQSGRSRHYVDLSNDGWFWFAASLDSEGGKQFRKENASEIFHSARLRSLVTLNPKIVMELSSEREWQQLARQFLHLGDTLAPWITILGRGNPDSTVDRLLFPLTLNGERYLGHHLDEVVNDSVHLAVSKLHPQRRVEVLEALLDRIDATETLPRDRDYYTGLILDQLVEAGEVEYVDRWLSTGNEPPAARQDKLLSWLTNEAGQNRLTVRLAELGNPGLLEKLPSIVENFPTATNRQLLQR